MCTIYYIIYIYIEVRDAFSSFSDCHRPYNNMRFYDVPALVSRAKRRFASVSKGGGGGQRALGHIVIIYILSLPNHILYNTKYINMHITHIRARTSFPRSDGASDRFCSKSAAVFRLSSSLLLLQYTILYSSHYKHYTVYVIVTCAYFM